MINLLPPAEKDKLKLERARNLTVILSGIVLVSLACLVLILVSLKFYILSEVSDQGFILKQAQEGYQSQDATKMKDIIEKYNGSMPQVLSFYKNEVYFSDILAYISAISKPQGLHFDSISLDGQKYKDGVAVSIFGLSDTRDNLLLFKQNIEAMNELKNISFSPESWISPKKVNFEVTFEFLKNAD